MRIEWLPAAVANRDHQLAYIGERDPGAAIVMGDAVEAAVAYLAAHPFIGRLGRVPGTREWVVSGTPFVMVYRVETEAVVILRLLHGAQQWPTDT